MKLAWLQLQPSYLTDLVCLPAILMTLLAVTLDPPFFHPSSGCEHCPYSLRHCGWPDGLN